MEGSNRAWLRIGVLNWEYLEHQKKKQKNFALANFNEFKVKLEKNIEVSFGKLVGLEESNLDLEILRYFGM